MLCRRLPAWCPALATRGAHTAAAAPQGLGILEYRAYTLAPGGMRRYLDLVESSAPVRRRLNPAWLGMFTAETGGVLNRVHHLYCYPSFAARASVRHTLSLDADWKRFIDESRPLVLQQESSVHMFATDVHEAARLPPVTQFKPAQASPAGSDTPPVYELRSYQLILGYNPVPELRKAFCTGIPAKLSASAEGQLAFVSYSEVGALNQVMELWRFRDATACIAHREASRGVPEWKAAIGKVAPMVQSFSTTFLQPVVGSPWQ